MPESESRCARCGKLDVGDCRFCPECGLPVSGGDVLSDRIREVAPRPERPSVSGVGLRRHAPMALAVLLGLFVVSLGLVLFNQRIVDRILPPIDAAEPGPIALASDWEPQWVLIPAGVLQVGEPLTMRDTELDQERSPGDRFTREHYLTRHSVRNGDWTRFLRARREELVRSGLWRSAQPPYALGWRTGPDGFPTVPVDRRTGEPDIDGALQDWESLDIVVIREYVAWRSTQPDFLAADWSITNGDWEAFLASEFDALTEQGLLESYLIGPDGAWDRSDDAPPRLHYEIELQTFVVNEEEETRERFVYLPGMDPTQIIAGATLEQVRHYHQWQSRWEMPRDYYISRYEIRNVLWRDFLESRQEQLIADELWDEALPGERGNWSIDEHGRLTPPPDELDLPVRNISPRAARAFAAWLDERIDDPEWEVRLPFGEEWEYAARGATWNLYPWSSDQFEGTSALGAGDDKARSGVNANHPLPVHWIRDDTSPFGVVGMGTNVAEWTYGGTASVYAIRGSSFADELPKARWNALVWEKRPVEHSHRFSYAGVRVVKVRRGRAGTDG